MLFDHRQASEGWDLERRSERIAALREAYGPAASWMPLSAIADYWDDPQATHAEFCRFWLNQPVPLDDPRVIDMTRWALLADPTVDVPSWMALAVAVSVDRKTACIAVAGEAGGKTLVMRDPLTDTGLVVGKVCELVGSGRIGEVALAGAQAKALKPDLTRCGVEFQVLPSTELAVACSAFLQAITDGTVVHVGQHLDAAMAAATTRQVGQSERWTDECDPAAVAASAALYRFGLLDKPMPQIF